MPTVNGISIPQEAMDFITLNSGMAYLMVEDEGNIPPSASVCTNCGGMGAIFIQVINPEAKTKTVTTMLNDKGHTVVVPKITKQWPCPICTKRTFPIISELLEDCGLIESELGLNLDYLVGKPGKEFLLEVSRGILALTPATHGVATFFGGYGTGKSCTMKAIVVASAKAGVKARYITAEGLIEEMQSVFDPDDEAITERTKSALIQRYMRYRVLCVDEIDRVGLTESGEAFLFQLINKRYDNRYNLCTIFASNEHPDRLPARLGYLQDRMRDGKRVPVGGPTLRGV